MWYVLVFLACNSDMAQTSEVFSSDLVPKSLRNIHPKKFRRAKCRAEATFSVKPNKYFRTAEIWMPGGSHICKSGLRTLLPSRTCWHGSSSEQSAPHTFPSQPHRNEVCLHRVRQRPGFSVGTETSSPSTATVTHIRPYTRRGSRANAPREDTFLTRMAAKKSIAFGLWPTLFRTQAITN